MTEREVRVRLRPPTDVKLHKGSVLRARIEDISRADSPPTIVGSGSMHVYSPQGDNELELVLPVTKDLDPQASYGIFVHLDSSGSGEIDVGDAITTASYPVLQGGASDDAVNVELHTLQ